MGGEGGDIQPDMYPQPVGKEDLHKLKSLRLRKSKNSNQ